MNYKVSVIVPVYNMEQYLERCLNSLKNQTLKELQVIVVNDGSTDNSAKLLEAWKVYDNFLILDKANGGLSDARNFGLKYAEAPYVAFVDSDDWVDTGMMQRLYELTQKHQAEIAICQLQKVNENEGPFKTISQLTNYTEVIDLTEDFSPFGELSAFACNKLINKSLFDGLEFPKGMHYEDIATIPRLILKSKKIAVSQEAFYNYFERQGSITKTHTEKGLDLFKACKMVKDTFQNSTYSKNKGQWNRFFIYQGIFSYLAYWAFVKDKSLKKRMLDELLIQINKEKICKKDILFYKREGKNYIFNLPIKKIVFYLLFLIYPKILMKF